MIPLLLAAGVLTVAAPCILPMLPMLPMLPGATVGEDSRARQAFITLGFVLAFSAVALLFNAFAESLELEAAVLRDVESAIRAQLDAGRPVSKDEGVDRSRIGSPEMRFGADRIETLANPERPRRGEQAYTAPPTLPLNHFALVGTWDLAGEHATPKNGGGAVLLRFMDLADTDELTRILLG